MFGKKLKTTKIPRSASSRADLYENNQKHQLDFAGSILDEKVNKINLLVAVDRFSKFSSVLINQNNRGEKNC